jgi:hypothetical protein
MNKVLFNHFSTTFWEYKYTFCIYLFIINLGYGIPPIYAFVAWTSMVLVSFYLLFFSKFFYFFIFGWLVFAPFAHSTNLRRWRGLDPPLKSKKEN